MINNDILNLEPKNVWKNFLEISKIPRPSKHEDKIRNYLEAFGKKLNLETIVDEVGNVLIKKNSTNTSNKTVLLQSHMDMVPQKNNNTKHDFLKDEIKPYIDSEYIKARGTTLGADNGIGVATMMAILESSTIKHPRLECLFTTDEETGMTGATNIKKDLLNSSIMINLDSEEVGEICVGCAGCVDITISMNYTKEIPTQDNAYKIILSGLLGGHSGAEIDLGRANANKLLNEFLIELKSKENFSISTFTGGSLRNAIPRESFVEITIDKSSKIKEILDKFELKVKEQFKNIENNINFIIEEISMPENVMDKTTALNLIQKIKECPNAVFKMNEELKMVETSNNLAMIRTTENKIKISCMARSLLEDKKYDITNKIKEIFKKYDVKLSGDHPGWQPKENSEILEIAKSEFEKLYNKKAIVKTIHAGLECGLIGTKYPKIDMISIGPTIQFPHSADERCEIKTVKIYYNYLLEILKNI